MTQMILMRGTKYDVNSLKLVGWTGENTDGYNLYDYFAADGTYLGADEDGIEPMVERR